MRFFHSLKALFRNDAFICNSRKDGATMVGYTPQYLDLDYDEGQRNMIVIGEVKLAQDTYLELAKLMSTEVLYFKVCYDVFARALDADYSRHGGSGLNILDFSCSFVIGDKAFPQPVSIESKSTGSKMKLSKTRAGFRDEALYALFFAFLYMYGFLTFSSIERIGVKSHEFIVDLDVSGMRMLESAIADDFEGMFNQNLKAVYDLWFELLCKYYYIEWDRDDPDVTNECLIFSKEGVRQEDEQDDGGSSDGAESNVGDTPKSVVGKLLGLFGRK